MIDAPILKQRKLEKCVCVSEREMTSKKRERERKKIVNSSGQKRKKEVKTNFCKF